MAAQDEPNKITVVNDVYGDMERDPDVMAFRMDKTRSASVLSSSDKISTRISNFPPDFCSRSGCLARTLHLGPKVPIGSKFTKSKNLP